MNTIDLERMTFAAQQVIGRHLANEFAMPVQARFQERMYGDLALQVRLEVFAQHLDRATVRYHETWRDAVKDRLYAWLRSGHWPWGADLAERRWPIRWHETIIDVKALYPKIGFPHERHSVTVVRIEDTSDEQRRLWFDAKGGDLLDLLYQLHGEGRKGYEWAVARKTYYEVASLRSAGGMYLFEPDMRGDATLFGMKVTTDRTLPDDTIELRDAQGRVVGKIYNIG